MRRYPDCSCSACTGEPLVEDPDPVKAERRARLLRATDRYGPRSRDRWPLSPPPV